MGYANAHTTTTAQQATPHGTEPKAKDRDLDLCFWLGFFLLVYGIIIAAIVKKGDGVREAVKGALATAGCATIIGILVIVNL